MERENIAALIRAVADERDDFPDFIETMRYEGALPRAFRKLARLNPSLAFRRRFLTSGCATATVSEGTQTTT